MDKLTDHELQILREINGDLPASSWGAWVGACYESLSEGGYITREGITEKGKQYLATASLASASAGDGELEPRCRDDKLLPALKECILTLGAAGEFHDTGVIASALERIQFDAARIRALTAENEALRRERGWRCFHCDEVFTTVEAATEHFGKYEDATPGCCIDLAEYRRMEQVDFAHRVEDDECSRTFHRMQADHLTALRREEEKGYERGLRDAGPEALARAESSEFLVAELREKVERLESALIDATAHLAAATSSYERFCRRGVTGDALYSTKLADYQKATDRARSELEAGHE